MQTAQPFGGATRDVAAESWHFLDTSGVLGVFGVLNAPAVSEVVCFCTVDSEISMSSSAPATSSSRPEADAIMRRLCALIPDTCERLEFDGAMIPAVSVAGIVEAGC